MRNRWMLALALMFACVMLSPDYAALAQEPPDEFMPGKLEKVTLRLNPGGHTAAVTRVFFSKDSEQVITASADHSLRIWDIRTGATTKVIHPPGFGGLYAAALSPDRKTLAVGSRYPDGAKTVHVIYLVSLADGRVERVLQGHPQVIEAIAFSADGKRLASSSGGKDGTVLIWDPAKEKPVQALPFSWGDPLYRQVSVKRGLAFSPDGTRLARARLSGGSGDILNLATGTTVKLKAMGPVAWSHDGETLAAPMRQKMSGLMLWNAKNGTQLRPLLEEGVSCHSVVFSSDSRTVLATWGSEGQASIIDVATGKKQVTTKGALNRYAIFGALSPDDKLAATTLNHVNGTHGFTVWKTADAEFVLKAWPTPSSAKVSKRTGWSADGKAVTWPAQRQRTFNLAELTFRPPLPEFHGPKDGPALAKLKGYHKTLVGPNHAAAAFPREITLYDAATGKQVRRFEGHQDEVNDLAPSPDGRFLLSTSMDQTLKIWSLDQSKALLSLYVQGEEWIVWTEEGYYAASPGGERLVGWTVDNGIDKEPTFHPAARFRASLYRPDVIRRVLAEGSVARAIQAADKARGQVRAPVDIKQVLPPEVRVKLMPAGAAGKVTVEAEAWPQGAQPVTQMQLLIDDRPFTGKGGLITLKKLKAGPVKRTWTIDLAPGPHDLRVLARTDASLGSSRGIQRADPQAVPVKKEPSLYVLAVGINAYPGAFELRGAVNDARNLSKAFRDNSAKLFRTIEIKEILDKDASRASILAGLDWLKNKATSADVGVFFFAGHGERDKDEFYLVPQDANTHDLAKTGISRAEIKKRMQSQPGKILVLLDACHAGAVGLLFDDLSRDLIDEDCGVAVMCAARPSQFALENKGQGYFTQSLVGGLGGKGPQRNGSVFLHHLQSYVIDEVSELSQNRQHPVAVVPPWMRPFALSRPTKGL